MEKVIIDITKKERLLHHEINSNVLQGNFPFNENCLVNHLSNLQKNKKDKKSYSETHKNINEKGYYTQKKLREFER